MAVDVATRRPVSRSARLRRDKVLILMTVPGILALIAFHYPPLLGNVIAFQDYQPFLGIRGSEWTGLEKFGILANGDPDFPNAVINTLVLTLVQVIFVFPAPIVLALMINSLLSERLRRIVQNVLYLPHFLSWVVVVAIFQQLLGGTGLLNSFLRSHGFETLDIIGNPDVFVALLTSQVGLEGLRLGHDPVPGRTHPGRSGAVRGLGHRRRQPAAPARGTSPCRRCAG